MLKFPDSDRMRDIPVRKRIPGLSYGPNIRILHDYFVLADASFFSFCCPFD
jgi:hypothetical protein